MFAAYSEEGKSNIVLRACQTDNEEESRSSEKWLKNSSFPTSSNRVTDCNYLESASSSSQLTSDQRNRERYVNENAHSSPRSRSISNDNSPGSDCSGGSNVSASWNIANQSNIHKPQKKVIRRDRERKSDGKMRREGSRKRRKDQLRKRSRERSRNHSRSPDHRDQHKRRSKYDHIRKRRQSSKHREKQPRSSSSESSSERTGENEKTCRSREHQLGTTFFEDRGRDFGNFKVPTLSRPSVALYRSSWKILGGLNHRYSKVVPKKKTLKHRYYNRVLKVLKEELEKSDSKKNYSGEEAEKPVISDSGSLEEELSRTTAKFNRDLSSDPQNSALWLKYVRFQDVVHQFELSHRRGGGAAGLRVTAERKLSILDKALEENPGNSDLLIERCQLAESVLPSDKLSSQLKLWVSQDQGNLVIWRSLIMATQGSLSACRVPVVKSLYQEALASIHGLRRSGVESVVQLESKIIDLVLHLGLFLRQAGMWELMWSLFHVYLEFNLAKLDSSKFNISSTVADNALVELEEAILGSQMPLPTLWLRVEMLRSGTHWVSLPADTDSEDPQRIIFPEDVNDLIHPISTPHLSFRLVAITLALLKVPLLPWRQSAAEAGGLHSLPWLLDGPEPLYASLLSLGTLEFRETSKLLSDAAQMAHGPQFFIARPGQDEYIDFLTQVFSACSECLHSSQHTYILVWWLRFYRWLIQLERLGHCKLPRNRRKKMRSTAKDLLRRDCNRSNLLLFKEFALLEWEFGSVDGARKVLQGAIAAQPSSKPVPFSNERAAVCALYRTLVELSLSHTHTGDPQSEEACTTQVDRVITEEDRQKALRLLISLGRGIPLTDSKISSTDIAAALSKFDHISRELFSNPVDREEDLLIAADVCHVAPSFIVEWTSCRGWLLYLSDSVWKAGTMFEEALDKLKLSDEEILNAESASSSSLLKVQREAVFEGYVSLLRHHCHLTHGSYGVLRGVLLRSLKEFPGNHTLLAAFADLETTASGTGLPSWRLSKTFMEFNTAVAYALLVFVMRHRLKQQEELSHSAFVFLNQGGPEVPNSLLRTRMDTLLKKLTKHPVIRRSPLLWRLRLQFAAAFSNKDTDYHSTFYLALEDCPWAKALYMDIVQVLPMQLGQVQDLLIEKELRLHVTPEELEILRTVP